MSPRWQRWRGVAACAIAVAAELARAAGGETTAGVSRLATPHPGRLLSIELYDRGASVLRAGRPTEAEPLLERAVAADPLAGAAWTALAAARIEVCDPDGARFAALVAVRTAGSAEEAVAAEEAAIRAAALTCEPPAGQDAGAVGRAEAAVAARSTDYRAWAEAAAARRARGDLLLAAFDEEQALALGGEPAIRRMKLVRDLEQAGLWRAALALLAGAPDTEGQAQAERLAARIAEQEPAARRIASRLAAGKGWTDDAAREGLDDLALAALAAEPGESPEAITTRLAELLAIAPAAAIEGAWGRAPLLPGWSAVEPPAGLSGSPPAALLRRFPGDTQLAVCDPGRSWTDDAAASERFVREVLLAGREPQREQTPGPCLTARAGTRCERTSWSASIGAEGRATVTVHRLAATGTSGAREIWVAGLAGNAGCGGACGDEAARELAEQVAALEPAANPPGDRLAAPCDWPIPAAFLAERTHREREEPWRRIGAGEGLVIELPPGVVAARVDRGFRDDSAGPETVLWLRGSFEDQVGTTVRIGGVGWAGWVDLRTIAAVSPLAGGSEIAPPRTDPQARRLASADLTPARRAAGLPGEATTARFAGAAFPGTWFVHRVRIGARELEIGLPIAAGEKSLAPLWIAITARAGESEAPPPPYDLARRYRVRFDRHSASHSPADPREGTLVGEGIRFLVPRGYRATLNGTSADGFPVTLRNDRGSLIVVLRLGSPAEVESRCRELEREWGAPTVPWRPLRSSPGRTLKRAEFPPEREEGRPPRRAATLVTEGGAFLVLLTPGNETDPAAWTAESELVTGSLKGR